MIDLLVIGGGMAGLAAGELAARSGARVVVLEKNDEPGGSAAISSGIFWLPPDLETYQAKVPLGDPSLASAIIAELDPAIVVLREMGVDVTERFGGVMGFGVGHRIDVSAFVTRARQSIERQGGRVRLRSSTRTLLGDASGVRGAIVETGDGQGRPGHPVQAHAVVLATGGFQRDPDLVSAYVGPRADHLLERSSTGSVGDGLRLGRGVGAASSRGLGSFYGHLMPSPIRDYGQHQYLPLTQYHSKYCVLVNRDGRRFCDESRGDEISNQALLHQPDARAVLICDEQVRLKHVITPALPHTEAIDRFAAAVAAGARYATGGSVAELVAKVAAWGVPAANLQRTLDDHVLVTRGTPVPVDAPVGPTAATLGQPPLHALEVQPSITFTFGGLRTDVDGRVLDPDGRAIPGLFAAGADAGGFSNEVYAGGLAPAFITGRRAARAALARR
jgi:succinate dehydrogenase/fumarate reductase flavoprotein subunit